MAVRGFDGTDDVITCANTSSLQTPSSAVTLACWFRTGTGSTYGYVFGKARTTGDPYNSYNIQRRGSSDSYWFSISNNAGSHNSTDLTSGLSTSTWYFFVGRWAAGETLSLRVYNSNGSVNQTVTSAGTSSGTIGYTSDPLYFGMNEDTSQFIDGRLAVAGVFATKLADVDAESLMDSLQTWLDLSATGLWALNQASTATAVEDLAGTADQTAITGTTVVGGDDPPGFDFSLGTNAAAELASGAGVAYAPSVTVPAVYTQLRPAVVVG